MTLLEVVFNVDRVADIDNYDKYYEFWSIDKSGVFLLMTYRKDFSFFTNAKHISDSDVDVHIDYIWENYMSERPLFIPYEELETLEKLDIEFKSPVCFDCNTKYPLVCVRGTCDKQCKADKLKTYCFHELPCTNKRPDWNCWTAKYPNFYNLLFDVAKWIGVCPHLDVLVVFFEFTPYPPEEQLDFDYCEALLINGDRIKVYGDSTQVKSLYEEYNKKFPTEDRQIEKSISYPEEGFIFRF